MVYQEKLVASIKCNGKILRDFKEGVYLPFGSEYSILLKNLHSKKALVNVYVDGRTVIEGLILHPSISVDNSVELERFFEENRERGHKLKFIEKTDDIKEFRGDYAEDGLVRVIYQFEADVPSRFPHGGYIRWDNSLNGPWYRTVDTNKFVGINDIYSTTLGASINHSVDNISYGCGSSNVIMDSNSNMSVNQSTNDEGITVEGEYSNQRFTWGSIGLLEDTKYTIVIPIKGLSPDQEPVEEPIGSRDKIQCKTCDTKWKSNMRFCGNCGTALI